MSDFATAPKFDPSAPFEHEGMEAPPSFDPSKPFEHEGAQPRTPTEAFGRQLGLTGRYLVEGGLSPVAMAGDAVNSVVNMGIEGVNKLAGTSIPKYGSASSEISRLAGAAGMPAPETPTERVVGEATKALASVPTMAAGALASGARALAPLATNLGMQSTSAIGAGGAYQAAKEEFPDSPGVQIGAGLAGGLAGGLRSGGPTAEAAQRISDFAGAKIRPALQDVSQSATWQRISKLLEAIPFTSDTVRAKELARLKQAEESAAGISKGYGDSASPQATGETVQSAVERYRFGKASPGMTPSEIIKSPTRDTSIAAKANALYDRVPVLATATIEADKTKAAVQAAATKFQNNELSEEFSSPLMNSLTGILERSGNMLSWQDLRNLRTEVRYARSKASLDPTVDDRALNQVDAALSEDMLNGARVHGGDRAAQLVSRADSYYAQSMQRVNDKLKTIYGANRPEAVYAQIENALSANANKADYGKLIELRRALSRDEWNDIAATVVDGLGRPKAANALPQGMPQFSAAEFVRKFGSMSPQAKTILFDGAGKGDLRGALDALGNSLGNMKNTDRLANVSQSGNAVINYGTIAAAVAKPQLVVPALVASNLTARAMYNPTFIKLMTRTLRGGNPATVQQTATQITKFAQQNPELANDAAELLQNLVPVRAERTEETNRENK